MKPTIGRVVIYNTTEEDKASAGKNFDNVVQQLPAIIVNVWSDTCINVRVFSDGGGMLWKTSINQGDQPGQWNWPVIESKHKS